MSINAVLQPSLFGLFEVDTAGTVLYSRTEVEGAKMNVAGHNFHDELAAFSNAAEFHQRIDGFTRGSGQADSFNFSFQLDQQLLPVKVLVARLCDRTHGEHTRSILIHIRKVGGEQ